MHYDLKCLCCGAAMEDDGTVLNCKVCCNPGLIRTDYHQKVMTAGPEDEGIYRFAEWLPVTRRLKGSGSSVTFKSEALNARLGLQELWITFNGYWPERNARMMTATFKECEAYTVCARLPQDMKDVLVVASAGNTARAFARVCSENKINLLLVVPEKALPNLWSLQKLDPCVKILTAGGDSDYFNAIDLSNRIVDRTGFVAEGGARNVARRDGMSSTVYSAVTTIGKIPDYYFQAVGSGTGAIAAWEANLRFIESGKFGNKKMRLMVSQNEPFIPMVDSWNKKSRKFICPNEEESKKQIDIINAKVLSNRKPPWGLTGGLYDALEDTDGTVLSVDNDAASQAAKLFEQEEGIDISPESGIALASLIQVIKEDKIKKDALIMVNITGGGEKRVLADHKVHMFEPHGSLRPDQFTEANITSVLKEIYSGGK